MQTIYKRFSVITGFSLLLLLLAGGTFMTQRQLGVQAGDHDWVLHSRQVLGELSQTESLLKDAETGQRGYLYTGDPKYLEPYYSGVGQLPTHLDNLSRLTADNASQQARIRVLRSLVQQKLDELAHTIALQRAGEPEQARAVVSSDFGLRTMDAIRSEIDQMEGEEDSLNTTRDAAYRRSVQFTRASIYISGAVAALGLILLAYFILREMEIREKHALDIREREEWYRVTLTSLGDGVIATDQRGLVTFLNPVAEFLTGLSLAHAQGKPIEEVFPIFNEYSREPVENPVNKVVEAGRVVGLANHTVLRGANGTLTPIEDSAAPIRDGKGKLVGVVLVFRDATAERKSQEILRKTEKLAAAARLAATVSHEINNPLEAIGNLIYIVKGLPDLPAAAVEPLDLAEQELERVAHITRQTLGFYRESKLPERIDLKTVIEYVLKLYSNKLNLKAVRTEQSFGICPEIRGVRGELTQAISNLVSNAIDATPANGTIRLTLSSVEESARHWADFSIEDDGPGVPAELHDKIFEPFFTTKKDVGTGLGLWVTKEIIERHDGTIELVSCAADDSNGATFRILLPAAVDS